MRKLLMLIFLSVFFAIAPLLLMWAKNHVVIGLNPFVGVCIISLSLILAVLTCRVLVKTFKQYFNFTPYVLFTIASGSFLVIYLVFHQFFPNSSLDIHLHDTYYVIPNYTLQLLGTIIFAFIAAIYLFIGKILKVHMNNILGYIHFWITYLSCCFLLLDIGYSQVTLNPRRYFDYNYYNSTIISGQNKFISSLILLLVTAQLIFAFNIVYTTFRKHMLVR